MILAGDQQSLKPLQGADRTGRKRLGLRGELLLALFPTATMLIVLALVEMLAHQRILFAALAGSAFLIYLDPMHGTNTIRTLAASHLSAAALGISAEWLLGSGYGAAGLAMVATILVMILLDIVHPPAIGTALTFAFRANSTSTIGLFLLALGMVVLLGIIEWVAQRLLSRLTRD